MEKNWFLLFLLAMFGLIEVMAPKTKEKQELEKIFGSQEEQELYYGMVTKIMKYFFNEDLSAGVAEEIMLLRMEDELAKVNQQGGKQKLSKGSVSPVKDKLSETVIQGEVTMAQGETHQRSMISHVTSIIASSQKIIRRPKSPLSSEEEELVRTDHKQKTENSEIDFKRRKKEAVRLKEFQGKENEREKKELEKREKEMAKRKAEWIAKEFLQNKARHKQQDREQKEENDRRREAFKNIYSWLHPQCKMSIFGGDLIKQSKREHILKQKMGDMCTSLTRFDKNSPLDEKENQKFFMATLYDIVINKRLEIFKMQYKLGKPVSKATLREYREERDKAADEIEKTEMPLLSEQESKRHQEEVEEKKVEAKWDEEYHKMVDKHKERHEALDNQKRHCKTDEMRKDIIEKITEEEKRFKYETQPYWDYKGVVQHKRRIRRENWENLQKSLLREGVTVTARMRFLKYNPIILPKKLQQLLRWPLSKDVVDDQCRGIRVYSKDTSNLFDNKFDHQASTKRERGSSLSPSFSPSDKLTDDDNLS